jgi:hypothetical protein
MKTALTSLITASLLGLASYASGRAFDAADFTAILFTTGLVAWTVDQYSREPRSLYRNTPIRLPLKLGTRPVVAQSAKLAA